MVTWWWRGLAITRRSRST